MKSFLFSLGILFLFSGCKSIPIDPSIAAAFAGDKTLIMSAGCSTVPAQGLDICRVQEGGSVQEVLTVVMPSVKGLTGELKARFKGIVKTYAINATVTQIPWKDLLDHDSYSMEDQGLLQLTGSLRADLPDGVRFTDLLGYAYLIVLGKGYSPMPIDSGNHAWGATCRVQISTSGRSAMECK